MGGLGWPRSWLPLGTASKDSAMVLWTRWASTGPPRTDPLEGRARAQGGGRGRHTLVDNNIGPSAI